jgi:hypothetical protein
MVDSLHQLYVGHCLPSEENLIHMIYLALPHLQVTGLHCAYMLFILRLVMMVIHVDSGPVLSAHLLSPILMAQSWCLTPKLPSEPLLFP